MFRVGDLCKSIAKHIKNSDDNCLYKDDVSYKGDCVTLSLVARQGEFGVCKLKLKVTKHSNGLIRLIPEKDYYRADLLIKLRYLLFDVLKSFKTAQFCLEVDIAVSGYTFLGYKFFKVIDVESTDYNIGISEKEYLKNMDVLLKSISDEYSKGSGVVNIELDKGYMDIWNIMLHSLNHTTSPIKCKVKLLDGWLAYNGNIPNVYTKDRVLVIGDIPSGILLKVLEYLSLANICGLSMICTNYLPNGEDLQFKDGKLVNA